MPGFVWRPAKGESDEAYIKRSFAEHPRLGITQIVLAKSRATSGSTLAQALEAIAALPVPAPSPSPVRAKLKSSEARELQLEQEIAIIRLERDSLLQRVAMLQRMIKKEHE